MPQVNVEINGRRYRMACEEGQEEHLLALASRFNGEIEALKDAIGEIGDGRLTVMAGIAVLDQLGEAERRIGALEKKVAELTAAGEALSEDMERLERGFADRIGEAALRLEAFAVAIEEAGQAPG